MKKRFVTTTLIILIWYLLSMYFHNDVLLPGPILVAEAMYKHVFEGLFYKNLFYTFVRLFVGLGFSFCIGVFLGVIAGTNRTFKEYFSPLVNLMKTIPNVAYIILLIIWFGSEKSVFVLLFLVLFPIIYTQVSSILEQYDPDLKDLLLLFGPGFWFKLRHVYLPHLYPYLKSDFSLMFGMGLKVCIMAEILGQVYYGVGKQIYFARNNLDMVGIMAWIIWVVIISMIVDYIFTHKRGSKNIDR